jgi:hypothetical protein
MNIVMSKAALILHLAERLKLAKAEDASVLKDHRKAEQETLIEFRAKLREALKWDYKTAKSKYFSVKEQSKPSCPRSQAAAIYQELRSVQLDTRKSEQFRISPNTDLYNAVNWLPASERTKPDLCE